MSVSPVFWFLKDGFVRRSDPAALVAVTLVPVTVTFAVTPRSVMMCANAADDASPRRPQNDNSRASGDCPADTGPPDGTWPGAVLIERLIDRLIEPPARV